MTNAPRDAVDPEIAAVFLEEMAELLSELPYEAPRGIATRIARIEKSCELLGLRTLESARAAQDGLAGAGHVDPRIVALVRAYTQDLVRRGNEIAKAAGVAFAGQVVDLSVPRPPRKAWWQIWRGRS